MWSYLSTVIIIKSLNRVRRKERNKGKQKTSMSIRLILRMRCTFACHSIWSLSLTFASWFSLLSFYLPASLWPSFHIHHHLLLLQKPHLTRHSDTETTPSTLFVFWALWDCMHERDPKPVCSWSSVSLLEINPFSISACFGFYMYYSFFSTPLLCWGVHISSFFFFFWTFYTCSRVW